MNVIEVQDLVVRYGAAVALDGISLTVAAAELVALIGPNGAGKSTLVNTLGGIIKPAGGRVAVQGRLAIAPEGRQVFADLSVEDNLRLGAWRIRQRDPGHVYDVLPDLRPIRHRRAGLLSGGQQQMVAVGRALMARPDVLVVDELSLGLAPLVVTDLVAHLRRLHAEWGLAVLLIEQNARLALSLCTRAYVLEAGRIVLTGPAQELARSPQIARAYLGASI
ncbi:MAG TPA: ABC transporter ATP-binding protein [Candidatus Limnocylindrales bacterium]